jgi:hypothetical protein
MARGISADLLLFLYAHRCVSQFVSGCRRYISLLRRNLVLEGFDAVDRSLVAGFGGFGRFQCP